MLIYSIPYCWLGYVHLGKHYSIILCFGVGYIHNCILSTFFCLCCIALIMISSFQNDNVGMSGPLVDAEGFPRNDIDVYQVRLARQTIICLQNDHKELMNQIQTLLNQYHSEIATTDPELVNRASALDLDSDRSPGGANITDLAPARAIVVVNLVSPDSPAERAVSECSKQAKITALRWVIFTI